MRASLPRGDHLATTGCVSERQRRTAPSAETTAPLSDAALPYFERSGLLSRTSTRACPSLRAISTTPQDARRADARRQTATEGVESGSSLSHGMARATAGLPLEDENAAVTRQVLLGSSKGSAPRPRTSSHRTVTGRLVDVGTIADATPEAAQGDEKPKRRQPPPRIRPTVLTDRAKVVHVEGADVDSVNHRSRTSSRLDAALERSSAHGAANRHVLQLLGKPGSPVTLGYIAETPVWRTTYRL